VTLPLHLQTAAGGQDELGIKRRCLGEEGTVALDVTCGGGGDGDETAGSGGFEELGDGGVGGGGRHWPPHNGCSLFELVCELPERLLDTAVTAQTQGG